jgi:hypothetical protein
VHALHNIHSALAPDAILVDTQPVSARPPVAGGRSTKHSLALACCIVCFRLLTKSSEGRSKLEHAVG